ncbi:homeodomain-interacting protein kinase 3-like [Thunnus maccoyii]|uniref:homeodomain-interacting protein kinase 3-like n=1 Tax=Thunnus maccoyii TaxID=8240 RepID=UPI001C4B9449|nr:homeodomain-interacting protein kinase 3-like [Thunnus maccoyii]
MGSLISQFSTRHIILSGNLSDYQIQRLIGEGTFGKVAYCTTVGTKENVAVKILKKTPTNLQNGTREVQILRKTNNLDPDEYNLVRFIEFFVHQDKVCLAFEKLDQTLCDLIKDNGKLNVKEIRPIVQQMLVALDALNKIGIIHTDIKPDNIMLVDHRERPFKVKLIDFGVAILASENHQGKTMQPLIYRSPEVILGLPITAAIDMWSLGCVLAYLYVGRDLYGRAVCEYDMLRLTVHLQGQPRKELLNDGTKTQNFFFASEAKWRLKTPAESDFEGGRDVAKGLCMRSLDDLYHPKPKQGCEHEDTQTFLSLLKQMLHPDWDRRITPSEALQHSFITEGHLHVESTSGPISEVATASRVLTISRPTHADPPDGHEEGSYNLRRN